MVDSDYWIPDDLDRYRAQEEPPELVIFEGVRIHSTDAALLLDLGEGRHEWFPFSQIFSIEQTDGKVIIEVPEWLADKKSKAHAEASAEGLYYVYVLRGKDPVRKVLCTGVKRFTVSGRTYRRFVFNPDKKPLKATAQKWREALAMSPAKDGLTINSLHFTQTLP